MKKVIVFLGLLICVNVIAASADIKRMRELFELVDKDEKYYNELDRLTKDATHHNPLPFAYRGLYYFMRAKYLYWPNQKLSSFNIGKKIMEAIIILNPKEPELRLIRYSVQYNVPTILGYSSNLKEDRKILKAAKSNPRYKDIHYLINGVLTLYP